MLRSPRLDIALLVAATGVAAYALGRYGRSRRRRLPRNRLRTSSQRSDDDDTREATTTTCECGAVLRLRPTATANERRNILDFHRASKRHVQNLAQTAAQLVVAETWAEYRAVAERDVRDSDICLEIGCGRGVTTELLGRIAERAVGVDKSAKVIEMARERFPSVEFCELDCETDWSALRGLGPFSVVFVDVNGSRELRTLLPILEKVERVLRPRLLVVKNAPLKRLVLKCRLVDAAEGT